MSSPADRDPAPAVTRSIHILGLLADALGRPLSLTELAREINAAKSSTSNLCVVLEDSGLIQRRDNGFILGRRTVELGGAYIASFNQVREFYRLCADADLLSHEVVQIAMLDGTDVLYLARHEGRAPFRLAASIGDRFPASLTAVGNALLSVIDPEEISARFISPASFPHRTERSISTLAELEHKLDAVRETGVAIDNGEVHPSVVGIAMVIPPQSAGEAPLAIGASLVEPTPEHRAAITAELKDLVEQLSNPLMVGP